MHILPIRLQDFWLALATAQVEQILGERSWLKVPSAPPQWPGVLAWQGRAVAVLDLGLLLGLPPLPAGFMRRRTLIVKVRDCLLALPVDEVHEAQLVAGSQIRPLRVTRQPYATSEVALRDTVMPLLEPEQLVSEVLSRSSVESDRGERTAR